jgi:hypothetical protein
LPGSAKDRDAAIPAIRRAAGGIEAASAGVFNTIGIINIPRSEKPKSMLIVNLLADVPLF